MLLLFSADSRLEQVVDNHSFKTDVMINKVRPFSKGSFINHVDSLGGGGLTNRLRHYLTNLYVYCRLLYKGLHDSSSSVDFVEFFLDLNITHFF